MELPYRALSPYLQSRFGARVHRVALDAGSDCPNRDGTKGRGGCVYCDVDGSGTGFLRTGMQITEQLRRGIERIQRQDPKTKAIAYFQSYSNTYVSAERLGEILRCVDPFEKEIAALSVATRPDTFPEEAARILAEQKKRFPVWVEFGLESADDETLKKINRLHTLREFEESVERARRHELEIVAHVILGLPGEGPEHFSKTAAAIRRARPQGVKIHQLMVLKKTILARWHEQGLAPTFDWSEYLRHLCDFLEQIPEDTVIHRILADARPGELIAPHWSLSKNEFRQKLIDEFARRGTHQGSRCIATETV